MRTLWCARPRRVRAAGHAEELSAVLLPLFPQRISRSTWSPCASMPCICNRGLSTATVRLPTGRPGTACLMRCSVTPARSATGAAPCAPTAGAPSAAAPAAPAAAAGAAPAGASTQAAMSKTAAAMSASVSMAPTPPATTEPSSACGGPSTPSLPTPSRWTYEYMTFGSRELPSYAREGHHVLSQLFDWQRFIYHIVYCSNGSW
jgi:hypothetical protein